MMMAMPMVSRVDSINYNPRYNPYVERTKLKDLSGLSFEETKVLAEVKDLVATLGDSAVNVQVLKPEEQWNGKTISIMGFMSTGVSGTGDFAIGTDTLQKMAEDKNYKQQVMSDIEGKIEEERKNKTEAAKLTQMAQTVTKVETQTRNFYMDFWNVDRAAAKETFKNLYGQAREAIIGKYEANFAYM